MHSHSTEDYSFPQPMPSCSIITLLSLVNPEFALLGLVHTERELHPKHVNTGRVLKCLRTHRSTENDSKRCSSLCHFRKDPFWMSTQKHWGGILKFSQSANHIHIMQQPLLPVRTKQRNRAKKKTSGFTEPVSV